MFLDEARLGASMYHPNLVQVLDLGQHEGSYYMALEYVRGPSLKELLAASGQLGLPMEMALSVAIAVCEGLHHLHSRKDALGRPMRIVHRDLNPDNIVISYEGAVKLIDLGVAKADNAVYETSTGVIKGTFGYMAPEQILSRRDVDHRADLFALGLLLYEMTLGVHPFGFDSVDQVVEMVRKGEYAAPATLYEGYPEGLARLVARCLEIDPNDRPADTRIVQSALEDICLDLRIVPSMTRVAEQVRLLSPDPASRPQAEQLPRRLSPDQATADIWVEDLRRAARPDDDEKTTVYKWPKR
jgi:serine/threonine-protein kinase